MSCTRLALSICVATKKTICLLLLGEEETDCHVFLAIQNVVVFFCVLDPLIVAGAKEQQQYTAVRLPVYFY